MFAPPLPVRPMGHPGPAGPPAALFLLPCSAVSSGPLPPRPAPPPGPDHSLRTDPTHHAARRAPARLARVKSDSVERSARSNPPRHRRFPRCAYPPAFNACKFCICSFATGGSLAAPTRPLLGNPLPAYPPRSPTDVTFTRSNPHFYGDQVTFECRRPLDLVAHDFHWVDHPS